MEGDTVTVACRRLAHLWRGCVVSLYCDNKSFQASAAGRSKAERLNSLVQELFLLMIKYDFILHVIWISTNDNVNADALSRVDPASSPGGLQARARLLVARHGAYPPGWCRSEAHPPRGGV